MGRLFVFYLLFQPKLAMIADISTSILGLFYGLFAELVRLYALRRRSQQLTQGDYWSETWTNLVELQEFRLFHRV